MTGREIEDVERSVHFIARAVPGMRVLVGMTGDLNGVMVVVVVVVVVVVAAVVVVAMTVAIKQQIKAT